MKIWLDDKLVDKDQAKVSVFDHGLLYGDGIFEGIRVYSGRIFEIDAHLKRLWDSAKVLRLKIPMTYKAMQAALYKTIKANKIRNGYIRLLVTRGIGKLGLNPFGCGRPCVVIIAASIQLYSEASYKKGLRVVSVSTPRNHPMALPPQVKSLNYLNNILAKVESIDANADEAILYNHEGYVAEASGDNVFIVKNGTIYTPPVQAGSLAGITRQVVIRLARQENLPVVEENLTRFDLYVADEFFLTGTAAEVIGVVDIDNRKVGSGKPGPMTRLLRKKFFEYAHSKQS